ncbi:hypothetical protein HYPSUDRAFT_235093 [Hypholoma sublateritium FD-334 SS-4]|uniref:Uncharacterized protein n=1 Tax=Hypholoma sublateritium (strain FD-334 SS-4) TaxID=945553 RepID=A0A0D2QDV2_HYPSF|nr:hypothetical protein HYPSUDRAFT_235093 [Hypholoma sublateritium FD-334 SS-4]
MFSDSAVRVKFIPTLNYVQSHPDSVSAPVRLRAWAVPSCKYERRCSEPIIASSFPDPSTMHAHRFFQRAQAHGSRGGPAMHVVRSRGMPAWILLHQHPRASLKERGEVRTFVGVELRLRGGRFRFRCARARPPPDAATRRYTETIASPARMCVRRLVYLRRASHCQSLAHALNIQGAGSIARCTSPGRQFGQVRREVPTRFPVLSVLWYVSRRACLRCKGGCSCKPWGAVDPGQIQHHGATGNITPPQSYRNILSDGVG